jgi:membrane-bound lytic murein transglycosylase D
MYGLPPELAYLPHVESSYNFEAYSKAGAAGLWQFMRTTAQSFLDINDVIDERRDPIISTIAAAQYLERLYNVFESWPIALTAYNYGMTRMIRATEKYGSDFGTILEQHENDAFRFASRNFYSCFIAASQLAEHAELVSGKLRKRRKRSILDLQLTSFLHLSDILHIFDMNEKQFRELNPSILPEVYAEGFPLPPGITIRIEGEYSVQDLYRIVSQLPDTVYWNDRTITTRTYTVKRGDNLSVIAARTGVSVRKIQILNNLSRKSRIYPGQKLQLQIERSVVTEVPPTQELRIEWPQPAMDISLNEWIALTEGLMKGIDNQKAPSAVATEEKETSGTERVPGKG